MYSSFLLSSREIRFSCENTINRDTLYITVNLSKNQHIRDFARLYTRCPRAPWT